MQQPALEHDIVLQPNPDTLIAATGRLLQRLRPAIQHHVARKVLHHDKPTDTHSADSLPM